MKPVLIVLSAAVLGGLGSYLTFAACDAFGVMGNKVVVPIDVFVLLIASIALLTGLLSVGLRALVVRGDERMLQRMERRIEELERRSGASVSDVDAA